MNRWRTLTAASLVLIGTSLTAAQTDPNATQPPAVDVISIEFGGGTVTQYIAALKKAAPGVPVNAIVSVEAAKQTLPPITLKSVSPMTALSAIEAAAGRGGGAWQIDMVPGSHPFPGDNPAVAVDFIANDRGGQTLEVFSTQQLFQGEGAVNPDILLTAVQAALDMDGEGKTEAQVMFHKDSGLLLVRGSGQQVHAVRQVVEQLLKDTTRRGSQTMHTRQVSASQQAEIKKAEVRVRLAEQQLSVTREEVGELEKMVSAGHVPPGELRSAQQRLAHARAEFEVARIDFQTALAVAEAGPIQTGAGGDDEVKELRATISQLQAEVQALRQQLGERKGGGTR